MLVNGYEIRYVPSEWEFAAHGTVEKYHNRMFVAERLFDKRRVTQEEFERIVSKFTELRGNGGEEELLDFDIAYRSVIK